MKKLKVFAIILAFPLLFSSCFDTPEVEPEDPGQQLKELLLGTQYYTANLLSGNMTIFPSMWMQQLSGIRDSYLQTERYDPAAELFDPIWHTYYYELIQRFLLIEDITIEHDAPVIKGMSHIMHAYVAGIATDAWGDLPFTEAINYFALQVYPAYDDQQLIYNQLFLMLNEGIALLEGNADDPLIPDDAHDVFYAGALDKWIKAARLMRLKFSLRTGHLNSNYSYALQLIQQDGLFTGPDDDMYFPFQRYQDLNNFWYDFDFSNGNFVRVGERMTNLMLETGDPRISRFIRLNLANEYLGSAAGAANTNASRIASSSNAIANQAARMHFLSYAEQEFIKAEVYYRHGMQQEADMAYNNAVKASLAMYNARDEQWEAVHASRQDVDLEQIMTAKYIALFLNPEVWTDWRRTGFPALSPAANAVNEPNIPRRFLYPSEEVKNNAQNVPAETTLYSRVWWDLQTK